MSALAYHLDPLHDLDGLSVRPQHAASLDAMLGGVTYWGAAVM